ncbi:MAG: GlsB/YeaQ/YmgE family stress response membrane protein [Aestuariivirga sp.]
MDLLVFLVVGAVAGWLAGQLVKGGGYGLIGDIIVGIVGSYIAGFLFPRLGISLGAGIVGAIISAAIGAIVLLIVIRAVKRN